MLRRALKSLRRARRAFGQAHTYENAVALQRAQRNFQDAKRATIRAV